MILILGDLLADLSLRIESFPVQAGGMQRVSFFELGPGGAANTAIAAARLGLAVGHLGEIGDDRAGRWILEDLKAEGVDVSDVVTAPQATTPVAGVIVDASGEPAYLGYPGRQYLPSLPETWSERIQKAEALFADGWIDHTRQADLILEGLKVARGAGVPSFFDPGPGNPALDSAWHGEACRRATVVLATEDEAQRISGRADPVESAQALLALGPALVVIKRGVAGCFLVRKDEVHLAAGLPVEARDATGAGDSLDAAVIDGFLRRLPLPALGTLANAVGAAKVQKLGTGRNVPTRDEVRAVLRRFGVDDAGLLRT
jgi:sugar/nucleoside kinase (ribokinase family)